MPHTSKSVCETVLRDSRCRAMSQQCLSCHLIYQKYDTAWLNLASYSLPNVASYLCSVAMPGIYNWSA